MFEFFLDQLEGLVQDYGLLGLFIAMAIGSSPIPIPVEIFALTALSLGASPIPTALFATTGATFGGLISYYVGKGVVSFTKLKERYKDQMKHAGDWLDKHGTFAVFIFALVPLPYDAIALSAGGIGMKKRKFVTATFAGRLLRYLFLVAVGDEALEYLYFKGFLG
jgi:undecaprenyl-diphosphatase